MASTTTNLALTKPASGEAYNIDIFNQNFQKIDDQFGFKTVTPSIYSNRVSITLSNCYKYGDWVIVFLKLHSNVALNANTVLTGFPVPAAKQGLSCTYSGSYGEIRESVDDGIVMMGSIPTNTDFIVSGIYNMLGN